MLKFHLSDGNEVQIDREEIQYKILEKVLNELDNARREYPGKYQAFKAAVNLMKTFGGFKFEIPDGENMLEYLIAHFVSIGFDVLEEKPLPVNGKALFLMASEPAEEVKQDEAR